MQPFPPLYDTFRSRRHITVWLRFLAPMIALIFLAACVPLEQSSVSQPISPPSRMHDSPLFDNRWLVETVTVQGEALSFPLPDPIYITFDRVGTLRIISEKEMEGGGRCGWVSYAIEYLPEQRFRLGEGISTAEYCGLHGTQFGAVVSAFASTDTYELEAETLILRGDEVEMILTRERP